MVLRLDRFDLVIFNLEVVDTLEIVQGAPFHPNLFRGGVINQTDRLYESVLFYLV